MFLPAVPVESAQPYLSLVGRPLRAYSAHNLLGTNWGIQSGCSSDEFGPANPACPCIYQLPQMFRAQIRAAATGPFTAVHDACPPVNRVVARDDDHVGAKDRIERGGVDQGGADLNRSRPTRSGRARINCGNPARALRPVIALRPTLGAAQRPIRGRGHRHSHVRRPLPARPSHRHRE